MKESKLKKMFDLVTVKCPRYASHAQATVRWLEDHPFMGWLLEEVLLAAGLFVFACILTTALFLLGLL